MNLLPLPALDGGRLAFIAYEAITRRKASPKVENMIHSIGFILLMALFVVVTYNDIVRVITSIIK
jgi:regulator of sigma E protease